MGNKKKAILAASLLVLWTGLAVWQWRLLQEPVHVPLTNVTGQSSLERHGEPGKTGLRVNLDLLASTNLQRQATFTVHRNIFAVPGPDGAFTAEKDPASGNQPDSTPVETLTGQEEKSELEQYRYLGFLRVGKGHRTNNDVAVLKKDDEVLVLKIGDRVDDHLTLKAINAETVTIRDVGTHRDQTVSLSKESSEQSEAQSMGQE